MKNAYLLITHARLLVASGIITAVFLRIGWLAFLLSGLFIVLHWFGQRHGQRHGLIRKEYQYSSLVSSLAILIVFFVLLRDKSIPMVLASVFTAVFVIKLLFSLQDEPMNNLNKKIKPVRTNWSLTASFIFLACYFFGENTNLMMISAIILGYLLFALGLYAKKITHLRSKNNS